MRMRSVIASMAIVLSAVAVAVADTEIDWPLPGTTVGAASAGDGIDWPLSGTTVSAAPAGDEIDWP